MEYEPKRPAGYSASQIALHWVIAALVVYQLIFGETMKDAARAARDGLPLEGGAALQANLHIWFGVAVLVLAAVRMIVRLGHGTPPPPSGTPPLQVLAAEVVHWAFYALLFAVPVSGLIAWYVTPVVGDLHGVAKPAFIILILLHVAAVAFHQFFGSDPVMRRMVRPGE